MPLQPLVVLLLSCVWFFATPWTVACQAPLSMRFPGKNTGVGCHFLLQGIFPTQGSKLHLLHCWWILYRWATKEAPLQPLLVRKTYPQSVLPFHSLDTFEELLYVAWFSVGVVCGFFVIRLRLCILLGLSLEVMLCSWYTLIYQGGPISICPRVHFDYLIKGISARLCHTLPYTSYSFPLCNESVLLGEVLWSCVNIPPHTLNMYVCVYLSMNSWSPILFNGLVICYFH